MQIRESVQQDAENFARLHVKVCEETCKGIVSEAALKRS